MNLHNHWIVLNYSQVVDFSESQKSGFIHAFMDYFIQHPDNRLSEDQLQQKAKALLKGCKQFAALLSESPTFQVLFM